MQNLDGPIYTLFLAFFIASIQDVEGRDAANRADQLRRQFFLVVQLILQKQNALVLIAWIWHIASCLIIP